MEDFSNIIVLAVIVAFSALKFFFKRQEEAADDTPPPLCTAEEEAAATAPLDIPARPTEAPRRRVVRTAEKPPTAKKEQPADSVEEGESEFAIRSAEEARKAIIWGEIMQRKY